MPNFQFFCQPKTSLKIKSIFLKIKFWRWVRKQNYLKEWVNKLNVINLCLSPFLQPLYPNIFLPGAEWPGILLLKSDQMTHLSFIPCTKRGRESILLHYLSHSYAPHTHSGRCAQNKPQSDHTCLFFFLLPPFRLRKTFSFNDYM